MQHYLRPDLLEAAGITDFDSWAATFGQTVTQIEMAPEGGNSFRQKTRFAKFTNVPEMLRRWHVSADIKTGEDLKLPVPALAERSADGQRAPETAITQPSDVQLDIMVSLGERADAIRNRKVQPEEDNMLKVCTDGRKAALDLRLLGLPMPDPGKIDAAADRITDLWRAHRDDTYPAPGGLDAPVRGSLQLVFCDIGTPSDDWNVYDELRDQLVAHGMPREAVRFVHDAKSDRDKGELFAACRAGTVAVLIGSTEKMGVGTNVQFPPSPCTTSTAPGVPPTSPSARVVSCARATTTPRYKSCGTSPNGPSTATCGRPSNAKPGSSPRSCAAAWTSARSRTSATPPCPTTKSRPWPPATRS